MGVPVGTRPSQMNKILFGLASVVGGSGYFLSMGAASHPDTIRPNTKVGPVQVGGLTTDEAARALRVWWESEKLQPLKLSCSVAKSPLPEMKPSDLGVTIDDVASVRELPMAGAANQNDLEEQKHPVLFKLNGAPADVFRKKVQVAIGGDRPAHVYFRKGAVVRESEVAGAGLDMTAMPTAVGTAIANDDPVVVPITEGQKHITDDVLKQIKQVVAEFSTHFPARNRPRSSNIKLAASKIDGTVLLPGERFSFNGTVGRRTLQAGFKLAGVYINGRHDTGVGGGICQVSTTLYNSALFADLKIHNRTNHSLPVPYVPLGRDATVDYGSLDLVFENTYPTPVALTAQYQPGKLTFRILGTKRPGLSVKVRQEGLRSWSMGVKKVVDNKLPAGKTRVIQPGSTGHSVRTYRLVFVDGKLVSRESLGSSVYGGDERIIAVSGPPTIPGGMPGQTPGVGSGAVPTVPGGTTTTRLNSGTRSGG